MRRTLPLLVLALALLGGGARAQSPSRCVAAPELASGAAVRGSTAGRADGFHASCAGEALSPDAVYTLRLAERSRVALRLAADYDAALYVRARCDDEVTELACSDDADDAEHAALDLTLAAGTYYVFVDGYDAGNAGRYELRAVATPAR